MTEERENLIDEIQSYYQKSLTEILIDLSKEPIVRDYRGNYYRVIGVGTDCMTDDVAVIYKNLMTEKPYIWTRELCDFLRPLTEEEQKDSLPEQKRCFSIISDFQIQLDLVPTKDLLNELSERENDILRVEKSNIKQDDFVIAHIIKLEDGTERLYETFNVFPTENEADSYLKRCRKNKQFKSDCFKILHRIFYN